MLSMQRLAVTMQSATCMMSMHTSCPLQPDINAFAVSPEQLASNATSDTLYLNYNNGGCILGCIQCHYRQQDMVPRLGLSGFNQSQSAGQHLDWRRFYSGVHMPACIVSIACACPFLCQADII